MKPQFSVITAVLDEASTLPATFASVEAQSVAAEGELEHIIIDGGSCDGSDVITERYASRAAYPVIILRQTGKGIYQALNQAIGAASGEIISILHANDVFTSPHILHVVGDAMADGTDVAYGDAEYSGPKARYYSARRFTPESLKCGFLPPHPSMFIRRKIYDEIGTFSTDYTTASDFDFCVRIFLRSRVKAVYIPLCLTRLTPGGISAKLKNRLLLTNMQKLRALRKNGFHICPLRLAGRYLHLFDK